MAEQSPDAIEVLEEILRSLTINKDNVSNKNIELVTPETEEMSIAPALAVYNENVQTMTPKSMVPDLEWFDGDRTKFKD